MDSLPEPPNDNTNPYKVLQFLRKGVTTGIEIVRSLGITSYNHSIFKLRGLGYIIESTRIIKPDGGVYWTFTLVE